MTFDLMITYSRIPDHYALIRKYKEESAEITAPLKMRGMLKDFQNLFALDQILTQMPDGGRPLEVGGGSCLMMRSLIRARPGVYEYWNLGPLDRSGNGPQSEAHTRANARSLRHMNEPDGPYRCVASGNSVYVKK